MNIGKYGKALAAGIGVFIIIFFMSMGHGLVFAFLYGLVPAVCAFALLIAKRITPLRRAIYFIFTFVFWFGFNLSARAFYIRLHCLARFLVSFMKSLVAFSRRLLSPLKYNVVRRPGTYIPKLIKWSTIVDFGVKNWKRSLSPRS